MTECEEKIQKTKSACITVQNLHTSIRLYTIEMTAEKWRKKRIESENSVKKTEKKEAGFPTLYIEKCECIRRITPARTKTIKYRKKMEKPLDGSARTW